MKKILLHTCCGICFSYPSTLLRELGYEVISYFYNPNIYPIEEFLRRRDELIKYLEKHDFEYIIEEYQKEDFKNISKGLENEPEKGKRCIECFYLRLSKTAQKAAELGIAEFSTTLTVSPHKISKIIKEQGELAEKNFGQNITKFAFFDFKKQDGFKKTNTIAFSEGMYRQNYCGCEYSVRK